MEKYDTCLSPVKGSHIYFKSFPCFSPGQLDGLVQKRRNSSALAVELCRSCTKPLNSSVFSQWNEIIYNILHVELIGQEM